MLSGGKVFINGEMRKGTYALTDHYIVTAGANRSGS